MTSTTRPSPLLMPRVRPTAPTSPLVDAQDGSITLHPHAEKMARLKGFSLAAVLDAANNPAYSYPNGRYEGQVRCCKGDICAVVDTARAVVVTVYVNGTETDLRADQRTGSNAQDALAYERKRRNA